MHVASSSAWTAWQSTPWQRERSSSQRRRRSRPCLTLPCVARSSPATTAPRRQRRTEKLFEHFVGDEDAGGAGGQTTYAALKRADEAWQRMKRGEETQLDDFVKENAASVDFIDYDVVICGGTLGIFLACTLQKKGFRVALVERGQLKGRQQEWNVSRRELQTLEHAGILTEAEIETCIRSEWERVRAGFHGGCEVWTTGILNLGISPAALIQKCREKFEEAGGAIMERRPITSIDLHRNGVSVYSGTGEADRVTSRLLIDCMGHFSPIVRQSRKGRRPDGVCLVVGTCARGFSSNNYSDLIKTNQAIVQNASSGNRIQYFWEAFPAGTGPRDRTTYMFAYVDATPERPSLEDMFEDYWKLMPAYQNVDLENLEFQRAMFGFFPTYKDSPLEPRFDRIVHVGDAGGLQSPLSFGGFGAMLRHLERHTDAISSALNANIVDRASLSLINPYNPGLSATWLFQKIMSAQPDTPPDLINGVLSSNFRVMDALGPKVLTPFLQDVTRFGPLTWTFLFQILTNPVFIFTITRTLGVSILMEWLPHYARLGAYQLASYLAPPLKQVANALPPRDMYKLKRYADALIYGSGSDYDH